MSFDEEEKDDEEDFDNDLNDADINKDLLDDEDASLDDPFNEGFSEEDSL